MKANQLLLESKVDLENLIHIKRHISIHGAGNLQRERFGSIAVPFQICFDFSVTVTLTAV